jgi:hypothetical protein
MVVLKGMSGGNRRLRRIRITRHLLVYLYFIIGILAGITLSSIENSVLGVTSLQVGLHLTLLFMLVSCFYYAYNSSLY